MGDKTPDEIADEQIREQNRRDFGADARERDAVKGSDAAGAAEVPPALVEPPTTDRGSAAYGGEQVDVDHAAPAAVAAPAEDDRDQAPAGVPFSAHEADRRDQAPAAVPVSDAEADRRVHAEDSARTDPDNRDERDDKNDRNADQSRSTEQADSRPSERVVYVNTPIPPKRKGNRGIGALIAVVSAILFAVLFALAIVFVAYLNGTTVGNFVQRQSFYVPVLLFTVGFVILVLLVNRAGWWAHVLGSIFVGLFVYFGTIGVFLLASGLASLTPNEAMDRFRDALSDPLIIAAGLIARETALWMGAAISARGRRVKARNASEKEAFTQAAEQRAEYERSAAVHASS